MPWLLASPGISSHDIDYIEYVGPHLTCGGIVRTCVVSMWKNDIKCKYMFMFTLKNLACKGVWCILYQRINVQYFWSLLWLSKVFTNGRRHYICDIFSHWLSICSAINEKSCPGLWKKFLLCSQLKSHKFSLEQMIIIIINTWTNIIAVTAKFYPFHIMMPYYGNAYSIIDHLWWESIHWSLVNSSHKGPVMQGPPLLMLKAF